MATSNIEKALTFLKGTGVRNPDLATKYIHPTKYTEHNPFAADGIEGLKEYISGFPSHNHHLKVIRAFQDDAYVFTQADGEILGQNTFFDVFKFEDELIVEHWSFSEKSGPPNQSGHTQLDGPIEAKHNADTEKNKAMISDYYQTFHIEGDHSKVPQYFSGDLCIRHEPDVRYGVAAFLQDGKLLKSTEALMKLSCCWGREILFLSPPKA